MLHRVFHHMGYGCVPSGLDLYPAVLLLLTLLPNTCSSRDTMTSEPPALPLADIEHPDPDVIAHFKEPYDFQMKGKLLINVLDIKPFSVRVTWKLSNTSFPDSSTEATVICETSTGTFVSDKVKATSSSFTFDLLNSDTQYIVCVYMLEQSVSENMRYLHYTCRPVSTIPVVRSDSIVGLVLALGYLFLMGGLGYIAWWLKKRRIRKIEEDKKRITEYDDEFEEIETGPANPFLAGPSSGIDANGGTWKKPNDEKRASSRGLACCTNSHAKFPENPEDETIHLHATGREISF